MSSQRRDAVRDAAGAADGGAGLRRLEGDKAQFRMLQIEERMHSILEGWGLVVRRDQPRRRAEVRHPITQDIPLVLSPGLSVVVVAEGWDCCVRCDQPR
jgi:hypothetical protein